MKIAIPAFTAGELSPLLEGRSDLAALKTGCRRLRNMIPLALGPAFQRPGTVFLGSQHIQSSAARLLPFTVSSTTAYRIELGNSYARVWGSSSLALIGQTPIVMATPWLSSELSAVQTCQANDVLWLCHRNYHPKQITRSEGGTWEVADIPIDFPPLRDANATSTTIASSGLTGTVTLTATSAVFTQGNVGGYFALSHRRSVPYDELDIGTGSGKAQNILIISAIPVNGEQFTIGNPVFDELGNLLRNDQLVYTWSSSSTSLAAREIYIGTSTGTAAANAVAAITANTAGGTFGAGTQAHPSVVAENGGTFAADVKAKGVLTISNNDVTDGDDDQVIVGGVTYTFRLTVGVTANEILKGVNEDDSLLNLKKAINLEAGAGTLYGSATVIHPTVSASAPVSKTLTVTAKTGGVAGNSIGTTVANAGSRLFWEKTTLTGGAAASTAKVIILARSSGTQGNQITVGETMSNGAWDNTSGFLTGGASIGTSPVREGDPVRVTGEWEVSTTGNWSGVLTLKIERETDVWETLRTWISRAGDNNVQSRGSVDSEHRMRLTFVGTGEIEDDAIPRAVLTAIDSVVTGTVKITSVAANGKSAVGEVKRGIWSTDPTFDWAEGAWSTRRGFPSAVTLHEQRLVFGRDGIVWGSRLSDFYNFERTVLDDSSYAYELAATERNRIVSLASQRGLIIMTEGDEWLMDGGQSPVITANARRVQRLSVNGSAEVQAILVGGSVIFVQAGGIRLNEYVFDFGQDNYDAVDLTELASHLSQEGITGIAWAPNPHGVLWAVTAQGSLLSMTYRRKAGVLAWAKHTTQYGAFESVCVTPGPGGVSDVSVTVRRTVNGVTMRSVERFDPNHWERLNTGSGLICMGDGGAFRTNGSPSSIVSGLWHLEGMEVAVMADGGSHPSRVVLNGTINLDRSVGTVVVGLPPGAELQPMRLDVETREGSSGASRWRIPSMAAQFYRTGSCQYADDESKVDGAGLYEVPFRSPQDTSGQPAPLYTGRKALDVGGSYLDETRLILRNSTMLPLQIVSLVLDASPHG